MTMRRKSVDCDIEEEEALALTRQKFKERFVLCFPFKKNVEKTIEIRLVVWMAHV